MKAKQNYSSLWSSHSLLFHLFPSPSLYLSLPSLLLLLLLLLHLSLHFLSLPTLPSTPSKPQMETKNRIPELTRKTFKHHKKEPVDDYEEDQSYDSTDDETDKKKKLCDNHSKGYGTSVTRKGSVGGGVTPPCCQAEKCSVDLTEAKRYHRRHKVCEHHSKAPVVIVAGLRQRFCQQCSRFHELFEFDETKRSCRRRLAGHNERRRKNSSESNGEASSRKSPGSQLKENHCRQADQTGRLPMNLPENATFKHFQIR